MSGDETAQTKRRIAAGFSAAAGSHDTVLPPFATFAEHLVEVASPNRSDRVLDVACGRGAVLRELVRRCEVDRLRTDGVDAHLHVMDAPQTWREEGFDA